MPLPESRRATREEMPVIDLAEIRTGNVAAWKRIAAEITQASKGMGFFYIVNHGIAQEKIDRMFDLARRFFALPMEEKLAISIANSENYRGYLPFKMMGADEAIRGNLHEGFQMHAELPPDDPDVVAGKPLHGVNQWPAAMPELRAEMMDYFQQLRSLSDVFLRMYATGLGLPDDAFTRHFRKPMAQYRFLHYPPQLPTDPGDQLGTRAHTDSGAFTFLVQDEVGGLEALSPSGEWLSVPPIRGSYVINIGEMMKVWTDGILAATPHRVINRYGAERYSMPFFATPDFDAVIRPLIRNPDPRQAPAPSFATSVEGDRPITCGEILLRVYGRIWPSTRRKRYDPTGAQL